MKGRVRNYPFAKKIDDRLIGRDHELAIHFVTPFGENVEDVQVLQSHHLTKLSS